VQPDIDNQIAELLERYAAASARQRAALGRQFGLRESDVAAIQELAGARGSTPAQLSERLGLSSQATSAMVNRLRQAGWLSREVDPDSRRSAVLRLTASAPAQVRATAADHLADVAAAARALSAEHRALVARFLAHAAAAAERHADRRITEAEAAERAELPNPVRWG
jgi:DNA-binding MarR family transcriptional regulator